GLVAEMRSGLEQCLHGDVGGRHNVSPSGYASAGPRNPPSPKAKTGTGMMATHVECGGQVATSAGQIKRFGSCATAFPIPLRSHFQPAYRMSAASGAIMPYY